MPRRSRLPYDRMLCPVTGEVEGTVPGIKRRVRAKYGFAYDRVDWPPVRTPYGLALWLDSLDPARVEEIIAEYGVRVPPEADLVTVAAALIGALGEERPPG